MPSRIAPTLSAASIVLNSISLELGKGELVFLLGRNGSGKTTLVSLLTGFLSPQAGSEIAIFGTSPQDYRCFQHLGVVFQQPSLDGDLSLEQNLHYYLKLKGLSPSSLETKIESLLDEYNLSHKRQAKIRSLSGGQKRLVELIRALLGNPQILILDEPTSGIDIESRAFMKEKILELCSQGMAVLWTTHIFDEIDQQDAIAILHRGELSPPATPAEILKATHTSNMQQAFLQATQE